MAATYESSTAAPMNTNLEDIRKSKTYHPSVWKNHFLSYTSDVTEISAAEEKQHQKLKERVKKLLAQTPDDSTLKIELIDAIQRLGVGYHFQKEIHESLQNIHQSQINQDTDDLRVVALRFCLLRMQGFRASCDEFKKFIDDEGNFKESLKNDIEGMLSLYEASYYGLNGEETMDKAYEFSSSHLESLVHKDSSVSKRVKETLEMPVNKTLIRLGIKKFMSKYQEDESRNGDLLNFAKLDFNLLQKMHQEEANHITRWWEELDLANKLPFARDRVVECYFWILGVFFEPHYKNGRLFLSKALCMVAIFDDVYDVYGSLDELRRFTHAIERWDISAADELPPYMRISYKILLGLYDDWKDELTKEGQTYRVQYAIHSMKQLLKSYMDEAEWCYSKNVPTMDEYMKVAMVSAGHTFISTSSMVGMGDAVTKHHLDWIINDPPVLRASNYIARIMDDLCGHGEEEKVTAVNCYMNEHGCSEMEALIELSRQVKKGWKDFNEECMEPRTASMEILARMVNLCHVLHIMYSTGEDGFSHSETRTKEAIKDVLVEPIN